MYWKNYFLFSKRPSLRHITPHNTLCVNAPFRRTIAKWPKQNMILTSAREWHAPVLQDSVVGQTPSRHCRHSMSSTRRRSRNPCQRPEVGPNSQGPDKVQRWLASSQCSAKSCKSGQELLDFFFLSREPYIISQSCIICFRFDWAFEKTDVSCWVKTAFNHLLFNHFYI